MTEQDILNAGYKEYERTLFDHKGIEKNYQKCIRDDKGKKYFIDIHKWKDMRHPYTGELIEGGYDYTCQLTDAETECPLNLNFFCGWTIEQVEEAIEKIWQIQYRYYEARDW